MLGEPNGTLTDSELQSVIMQLQSDMPALGQTMVWEWLGSMGFSITRERVRNAIRAIDPIETKVERPTSPSSALSCAWTKQFVWQFG